MLFKAKWELHQCRAWMVILSKGRGTDESLEEKFRLVTISLELDEVEFEFLLLGLLIGQPTQHSLTL